MNSMVTLWFDISLRNSSMSNRPIMIWVAPAPMLPFIRISMP